MTLIYFISSIIFIFGIVNPLHIPPWNSFHSEFLCAASIMFLAISIAIKRELIAPKKFIFLFIILLIFIIIATFHNFYYYELAIYVYIYTISFICGINNNETKENNFYFIFLFISLIIATTLFLQFFNIDSILNIYSSNGPTRRPGSSLLQPNHAATFVCIGLIACIQINLKQKILKAFTFLILAFALGTTESRTGLLAFLIYSTYSLSNRNISKKILLLSSITVVTLYLSTPSIHNAFYDTLSSNQARIGMEGGRLKTWPILMEAVKQNPLQGYGFNNVFTALDSQVRKNETLKTEPFHYSHNILIDFLLWFGIPIALLIFAITLKLLFEIFKPNKHGIELLIIPIIIHSLFEYPHAYMYFGIPFFYIAGKSLEKIFTEKKSINRIISLPILLISILTLIFYSKSYIETEELIRKIRLSSAFLSQEEFPQRSNTIKYFEMDEIISKIKINKNTTTLEVEYLKSAAQQRASKTYQKKYAEALFITNQCSLFNQELDLLERYYGKKERNRFISKLKIKENTSTSENCVGSILSSTLF